MKNAFSLLIALDVILTLALIDQVSKWFVLETIIRQHLNAGQPGLDFLPWLMALELERLPFVYIPYTSYFNIVMVWNEGISFGALAGQTDALIYLLAAVIVGFGLWMIRTTDLATRFALAVIIGGALGNIWDRIRFGAVADFLDFHAYGFHYWAFNVADSAIVIGIVSLISYELFLRKDRPAA